MKPKSHTLFHFTKSHETLKSILSDGFWPKYCLEDVRWLQYLGFESFAYPMVCFCDIPLSRISEHVESYGKYGIGMTRDWAETHKVSPVQYVSSAGYIPYAYRGLIDAVGQDRKSHPAIRYLLAHIKPTQGMMGEIEKEFYQESEWRFVPKHDEILDSLLEEKFHDQSALEEANNKTQEYCSMMFNLKDIKYIFVANESDIPDMVAFVLHELSRFSEDDRSIIVSRILSLESLVKDI